MGWPAPQEYNEAIQQPALCFLDAALRTGEPETTALGLPRPVTGNFASVYRLRAPGGEWAVRCFWREFPDMAERYAALHAHLAQARLPCFAPFEYLPDGIRVGGAWYPILKMGWVRGEILSAWVEAHRTDAAALRAVAARWLELLRSLEGSRIAHGDLQHGNVLVHAGELMLVDYDGVWVPALGKRPGHELGHPNYQHPARTAHHFGPGMDRFSGLVIYLSLLALAELPDLWGLVNGGDECFLFRQRDFLDPADSVVLHAIAERGSRELRRLALQLVSALSMPPDGLPPVQPPGPAGLPEWVRDQLAHAAESAGRRSRPGNRAWWRLLHLCRSGLRRRLDRIDAAEAHALQRVAQRQAERHARVQADLERWQTVHRGLLSEIDEREAAARAELTRIVRRQAVDRILHGMPIRTAPVRLGPAQRLWLLVHGVRTAADLEAGRARALNRIRPADAAALLRWRAFLQERAEAAVPWTLPPQLESSLSRHYERRRAPLQRSLRRLELEAGAVLAAVNDRGTAHRERYIRRAEQRRSRIHRYLSTLQRWPAAPA